MNRHLNKTIALLLTMMLLVGTLTGCGNNSKPNNEATKPADTQAVAKTRIVTDSVGREVEIPVDIQKFAPSGSLAQIVLYGLAPDRLVGWTTKPTAAMASYFDQKYLELPTFGTFYGKNADLNMEALIKAAPQVVIDMGEVQGDKMKADLDALQKQLGIPVIFVEAKLDSMGKAYNTLGDILNLPKEAKVLADYCDTTITEAKEKAASIAEKDRVKVYYGETKTGLATNPKGSFHTEVIDLVGGVNVADIPITSGSGGNEISMEQLLLWAPDVMIFGPGSIYSTVGTDPLWKDLKAVADKKYYEIPMGPYNWMDRPPAVNRMIGVKWLGNLLYPQQFNYDMIAETKTFYDLFYHVKLTDQQAKDLMSKSTFAQL